MYILLKIKCAERYSMITRESAHEFIYEGFFQTRQFAEKHIEETNMTLDFITHYAGPGIYLYTVGTNPDYYILLDTRQIPDYPFSIARLTVS